MNKKYFTVVLGLTSAIAFNTFFPAQAEPIVYIETSGIASLQLEESTLTTLESIGLSLEGDGFTNTAEPFPGFSIASVMLPPSNTPGIRGSTFTFFVDSNGDSNPLSGTEEFTGSFIFNVDTNKLDLDSQLVIGEFSNSFDENFRFALTDTVTTQLPVFNVELLDLIIDVNTQMTTLELNLNFTESFSDFLIAAGATQSIAGLKFSQNLETRTFVPLTSQSIPESTSVIALFAVTLWVRSKRVGAQETRKAIASLDSD